MTFLDAAVLLRLSHPRCRFLAVGGGTLQQRAHRGAGADEAVVQGVGPGLEDVRLDDRHQALEVAFEADNTLQDPPLRLMPCAMLQRLQELNDRKEPVAREFYVSGEIIPSGDHAYLLPRDVRVKHELNEF